MSDSAPDRPNVPRWLHVWAILTACLALPLVALGAEVTTKQVGMADTTSVREPWYLATLAKGELWAQGPGLIIEHSHRTAGWLVGMAAIVLAVGTSSCSSSRRLAVTAVCCMVTPVAFFPG